MAKNRRKLQGPARNSHKEPALGPRGKKAITKPAQKNGIGGQRPVKNGDSKGTLPSQKHSVPLPLDPESKILLIGEGDFSFAASLAVHHGCGNITATTFESPESLQEKHPTTANDNITAIHDSSPANKILYSIDGTKLGLPSVPGGAELRKQINTFDTIWFNFPHVGGKSTDINRQVRANQALVVGFFESAKRMLRPGGTVVVALFDGMPYELWGIRNLARHVGLTVERSGRFEWERFPGYSHKRTLGDVDGGGGWKGEERAARVYVFRKEGGDATPIRTTTKKPSGLESEDDDD